MMGLGWQELLIVLMIILIVFGAGKLPQVGSALGRSTKEFKVEAGNEASDRVLAASGAQTDSTRDPGNPH